MGLGIRAISCVCTGQSSSHLLCCVSPGHKSRDTGPYEFSVVSVRAWAVVSTHARVEHTYLYARAHARAHTHTHTHTQTHAHTRTRTHARALSQAIIEDVAIKLPFYENLGKVVSHLKCGLVCTGGEGIQKVVSRLKCGLVCTGGEGIQNHRQTH